jgi:hypothetical protein
LTCVATGLMYVNGTGVDKDCIAAAKYFIEAARQGNDDAAFNVGIMYKKGLGIACNPFEAERWLEMAFEAGHEGAEFELIGARARVRELLDGTGSACAVAVEPVRAQGTAAIDNTCDSPSMSESDSDSEVDQKGSPSTPGNMSMRSTHESNTRNILRNL